MRLVVLPVASQEIIVALSGLVNAIYHLVAPILEHTIFFLTVFFPICLYMSRQPLQHMGNLPAKRNQKSTLIVSPYKLASSAFNAPLHSTIFKSCH